MKKVILTIGAPGSGKSTWATEQAKKAKVFIVCRDDLRQMMFGGEYKYSREKEKAVTAHVKQALEQFLEQDHFETMIIADTNLNESTRNGYKKIVETKNTKIKNFGLKVPTISVEEVTFDVPWVELEKRNLTRGNKAVPKAVLRSMHLKMQKYLGKHVAYVPNKELPKAVIFDIDGTLANNDHRSPYALWELHKDSPIEFVVDMLNMYRDSGHKIICVSGRHSGVKSDERKYFDMTDAWLHEHNIVPDELWMRKTGDSRKDDIIKEEIFYEHIAPRYNVVLAVDDRDRVVEKWRSIGVNCAQIAFGEF